MGAAGESLLENEREKEKEKENENERQGETSEDAPLADACLAGAALAALAVNLNMSDRIGIGAMTALEASGVGEESVTSNMSERGV